MARDGLPSSRYPRARIQRVDATWKLVWASPIALVAMVEAASEIEATARR